jgi:hypothetical protein
MAFPAKNDGASECTLDVRNPFVTPFDSVQAVSFATQGLFNCVDSLRGVLHTSTS